MMKKLAVKKKPLPKKSFPANYKEQQRKSMEDFAKYLEAKRKAVIQIRKIFAQRDVQVKETVTLDTEHEFYFKNKNLLEARILIGQNDKGKADILVDGFIRENGWPKIFLQHQIFNTSKQGIQDAVEAFIYLNHRFFKEEKETFSNLTNIARPNIQIDVYPKISQPVVTLTIPGLSKDDARKVLEFINNLGVFDDNLLS